MGRNTRIKAIEGFKDYFVTDTGDVYSNKKGDMHKMSPCKDTRGYLSVPLRKNGVSHTQRVHRLVLNAFKENTENKECGNHKDGIKINNNIDNLEWVTKSENTFHAYSMGLMDKSGEKNGRANITNAQVKEIKVLLKEHNLKHLEIANIFGVSKQTIARISMGHTWKEIK